MSHDCEEPLTQDDREVLSHMLFPLFEEAARARDNVTRNQIRLELGKFFPWIHISEVLKELEEFEYIELLSTRGGGLYIPGERYGRWAEDLTPVMEFGPETPPDKADGIILTQDEAEALVALIRELAAPVPGEGALKKAHAAMTEKAAADIIRKLALSAT